MSPEGNIVTEWLIHPQKPSASPPVACSATAVSFGDPRSKLRVSPWGPWQRRVCGHHQTGQLWDSVCPLASSVSFAIPEPSTVSYSQSSLIHLVGPSDCTLHGFVHGGKERPPPSSPSRSLGPRGCPGSRAAG